MNKFRLIQGESLDQDPRAFFQQLVEMLSPATLLQWSQRNQLGHRLLLNDGVKNLNDRHNCGRIRKKFVVGTCWLHPNTISPAIMLLGDEEPSCSIVAPGQSKFNNSILVFSIGDDLYVGTDFNSNNHSFLLPLKTNERALRMYENQFFIQNM